MTIFQKLFFPRTLQQVDWKNSILKKEIIKDEILELKQQKGKNIVVGSPALIVAMMKLNLVDEYQISMHPIIAGKGLTLFKNINEKITLKLLKTKTFGCGAVTFYYEPTKE